MKTFFFLIAVLISAVVNSQNTESAKISGNTKSDTVNIILPEPNLKGTMSVEEALAKRRSIREYKDTLLTLQDISQILWSAYGITDTVKRKGVGLRTAPSAMALYPLKIYIVAGNVKGLQPGVYCYHPKGHYLISIKSGDYRSDLCTAANNQLMVKNAAFDLVYSADTFKLNCKFDRETGLMLACLDLGHSAENVYLQATAMSMGTCVIAGLKPEKVAAVVNLPVNEKVFYIMPVGKLNDE